MSEIHRSSKEDSENNEWKTNGEVPSDLPATDASADAPSSLARDSNSTTENSSVEQANLTMTSNHESDDKVRDSKTAEDATPMETDGRDAAGKRTLESVVLSGSVDEAVADNEKFEEAPAKKTRLENDHAPDRNKSPVPVASTELKPSDDITPPDSHPESVDIESQSNDTSPKRGDKSAASGALDAVAAASTESGLSKERRTRSSSVTSQTNETERKSRSSSAVRANGFKSKQAYTTGDDEMDGVSQPDGIDDTHVVVPVDQTTDDIVSKYAKLPPLNARPGPLSCLTEGERKEIEKVFDFQRKNLSWNDDWLGDLSLLETEISNPDGRAGDKPLKTLWWWAEKSKKALRLLNNVIRHVYHHPKKATPKQAKKILANADPTSVLSLQLAVHRVSYDPIVLRQDGWTVTKASQPEGASGGSFRIGEEVLWQGYVGVIIAYLHDEDLFGDLWKAMWIDDCTTFDLELEELEEARRKFDRKNKQQTGKQNGASALTASAADATRRSGRNVSSTDFLVRGIEHGIVMATSYARGARPGVYWPARVLHASELRGSHVKRSNIRPKVDVVFLAPYWNSDPAMMGSAGRRIESFSDSIARHGDALFNTGPLFEIESIDASDESIHPYQYNAGSGLDLDELLSSFKFSGLPKAAFLRFVNSHRIALGLKTYSQQELKSTGASDIDRTTASLMEGHPLSVQTAHFPSAVLHLPFDHILSQLPRPGQIGAAKTISEDGSNIEPPLKFGRMLEAMTVPYCWGIVNSEAPKIQESPSANMMSPTVIFNPARDHAMGDAEDMNRFLSGLLSLQQILSGNSPFAQLLKANLAELARVLASGKPIAELSIDLRKKYATTKYKMWISVKTQGEELIASEKKEKAAVFLKEWRRCCERVFKMIQLAWANDTDNGDASGITWVLTDSRCNMHLTSSECFERAVRLPAAINGARQAKGNVRIVMTVKDKYLEMAEKDVILKAHKRSYIQRMKKRCASAIQDGIVALTEDSDGNGGHDTKGSKGTWTAALAAVGAALQATDMIMNGECLNVFCPTRPPGHHAGRELHAMKAVSNGFCVLNTVACAALYATSPVSEGGLGLSRVCVIDIDVHHGNGTQDILCSTYDPRFLYVSIHAGGAMINGVDLGDDAGEMSHHHLGRNPKRGIFPGRCGDTSPHDGVLNIPLGGRVTAHALGTALVTKVSPAVEKFAPELIIISAGFDAHKNDPLNMGGLAAEDFGTLTEVICKLAHKACSGRVLSVMEGGYGVPCCRPQQFPPAPGMSSSNGKIDEEKDDAQSQEKPSPGDRADGTVPAPVPKTNGEQVVPLQCLDLGTDMPPDMKDVVDSYGLQKRLDRCHAEGFIQCVREHVGGLARCNGVSG